MTTLFGACLTRIVLRSPVRCSSIQYHRQNLQREGKKHPKVISLQNRRNWGSRDGAVVRALALPPLWPGLDSRTRRHMWVEFVVGSRPCSEGFSPGSPVFLPPQKSTLLNSNSIWKQWMKSHLVEMPLQIPLLLLLLLLLLILFCVFKRTESKIRKNKITPVPQA